MGSFAQSPGTPITSLTAAGTLGGGELIPAAQTGSGSGCVGGYCGVYITPTMIKTFVLPINVASQITGLVPSSNGGTGVNNGSFLITLAGNLTTSGAFAITLTSTAASNATLPPGTSSLGYIGLPVSGTTPKTTSYTAVLTDNGQQIVMNCASACTVTIPANSVVAFPFSNGAGTCLVIYAKPTSALVTVSVTTDTNVFLPSGATGNRTMTAPAILGMCKDTATTWYTRGQNITDLLRLAVPTWMMADERAAA